MPKSITLTWPSSVQHHVLRLDVAVDDALAVRVGQRVEQLDADGDHVAVAELAGELVQRLAVDQLPDEDSCRSPSPNQS